MVLQGAFLEMSRQQQRDQQHRTQPHFTKPHLLTCADDDLSIVLSPTPPGGRDGRWVGSKVVATLGPSCQGVDEMVAMLRAGMSVARIDLTWGTLHFHRQSLRNLAIAMKKCHKLCAICIDTLGREIMVRRTFVEDATGWPVHSEQLTVLEGEVVILAPDPTQLDLQELVEAVGGGASPPCILPITCATLPGLVEPGDTMYVGRYLAAGAPEQGSLFLLVNRVTTTSITCTALNQAELTGLLTVFHLERSEHGLHNLQSNLPLLSQFDKDCLTTLASEFELDFVGLSFTRSAADVHEAQEFLKSIGLADTQIIAKVETRQALFNFQEILDACDGVLVSRGPLGLDVAPEKMVLVQKALVMACNLAGKPVIISRVLDSMSAAPRPTRAEATDVANIVLDGADGVLLGAETLRGKHPCESVRMAVSISCQAEAVFDHHNHYDFLMDTAMAEGGETFEHSPFVWGSDTRLGGTSTHHQMMGEAVPHIAGDATPMRPAAAQQQQGFPQDSRPSTGAVPHLAHSRLTSMLATQAQPPLGTSPPATYPTHPFPTTHMSPQVHHQHTHSYRDHPSYGSPGELASTTGMLAAWQAASRPQQTDGPASSHPRASPPAPHTPPATIHGPHAAGVIADGPHAAADGPQGVVSGDAGGGRAAAVAVNSPGVTVSGWDSTRVARSLATELAEEIARGVLAPAPVPTASRALAGQGAAPGALGHPSPFDDSAAGLTPGGLSGQAGQGWSQAHNPAAVYVSSSANGSQLGPGQSSGSTSPDDPAHNQPHRAVPATGRAARQQQDGSLTHATAPQAQQQTQRGLHQESLESEAVPDDDGASSSMKSIISFADLERAVDSILRARGYVPTGPGVTGGGLMPDRQRSSGLEPIPSGQPYEPHTPQEVPHQALRSRMPPRGMPYTLGSSSSMGGISVYGHPEGGMMMGQDGGVPTPGHQSAYPAMSKLESVTSSAVRAAEKVKASLIIVLTHSSKAPQLIAKYRPPMPILTLVVPQLVSNGLKWKLQGRSHARQCLLTRGLLPMLSAPGPSGDEVLEEAVATAARWGLVTAHQYVVVVERIHENHCVKIVAVDELGQGIKHPTSGAMSPAAFGFGGVGSASGRHTYTPPRESLVSLTSTPVPKVRSMVPSTPMVGRTLSMMEGAGVNGSAFPSYYPPTQPTPPAQLSNAAYNSAFYQASLAAGQRQHQRDQRDQQRDQRDQPVGRRQTSDGGTAWGGRRQSSDGDTAAGRLAAEQAAARARSGGGRPQDRPVIGDYGKTLAMGPLLSTMSEVYPFTHQAGPGSQDSSLDEVGIMRSGSLLRPSTEEVRGPPPLSTQPHVIGEEPRDSGRRSAAIDMATSSWREADREEAAASVGANRTVSLDRSALASSAPTDARMPVPPPLVRGAVSPVPAPGSTASHLQARHHGHNELPEAFGSVANLSLEASKGSSAKGSPVYPPPSPADAGPARQPSRSPFGAAWHAQAPGQPQPFPEQPHLQPPPLSAFQGAAAPTCQTPALQPSPAAQVSTGSVISTQPAASQLVLPGLFQEEPAVTAAAAARPRSSQSSDSSAASAASAVDAGSDDDQLGPLPPSNRILAGSAPAGVLVEDATYTQQALDGADDLSRHPSLTHLLEGNLSPQDHTATLDDTSNPTAVTVAGEELLPSIPSLTLAAGGHSQRNHDLIPDPQADVFEDVDDFPGLGSESQASRTDSLPQPGADFRRMSSSGVSRADSGAGLVPQGAPTTCRPTTYTSPFTLLQHSSTPTRRSYTQAVAPSPGAAGRAAVPSVALQAPGTMPVVGLRMALGHGVPLRSNSGSTTDEESSVQATVTATSSKDVTAASMHEGTRTLSSDSQRWRLPEPVHPAAAAPPAASHAPRSDEPETTHVPPSSVGDSMQVDDVADKEEGAASAASASVLSRARQALAGGIGEEEEGEEVTSVAAEGAIPGDCERTSKEVVTTVFGEVEGKEEAARTPVGGGGDTETKAGAQGGGGGADVPRSTWVKWVRRQAEGWYMAWRGPAVYYEGTYQ